MRKNKCFFAGLFGFLLVFGLILWGCPTSGPEESEVNDDPLGLRDAAIPNITLQPVSSNYEPGGTFAPLTVVATVSDSGTLSYQWYSNTEFSSSGGMAISGATGLSYTLPDDLAGDAFYYVVVTNTNENAERSKTKTTASSPVRIRVQAGSVAPSSSITIDPTTRYQYVRGFGGMSSVVFRAGNGGSSPDIMAEDIDIMYNPNGLLRYNMFRICLYDDMEGVITNQFPGGNGVWQDNSDYYELVKRVNLYGGYVLACPWTPPAYFKTNNSLVGGGHVKSDLYGEYAEYLRDYLRTMNDRGAPIYALSIQNEPNFIAAYEGCEWTSTEHKNFFLQEGHFTDGIPGYGGGRAIPSVRTVSGESANRPEDVVPDTLNDRTARANLDIVARHYYSYQQNRYALALDDPGYGTDKKEVWQTEHNINSGSAATYPNDSTWNYVWKMMNEVDCSQRLNDENVFIWWYAKRFYSFVGDGQYGTTEHEILPRGYAMAHYSRFATDTTRVGITTSGISSINNNSFNVDSTVPKVTAYESMDGNSLRLVIYTPTTTSGAGGVDLGDIQINLPWEASSAYALVSNANKKLADEVVVLSADKQSALITVPSNTIVSVQFTK